MLIGTATNVLYAYAPLGERGNEMNARCLLIGVVLLFVAVLTTSSYAKIDPKTCVGVWLFDEGDGNIAKDSSESKNDGTLMNDPKWVNGKFGKALSFAGVNDYVVIPKGAAVLEQQFSQMSLSAWVYPTALGGIIYGPTVISRTDTDGWSMRVNNGQLLADLRLTGGDVTATIPPAHQIALNAWSHIAITYSNSTGVITGYINGRNIGTLKGSGTIKNAANANTCTFIGTDPATCAPQAAGFDFTGSMDEIAIFDVALTDDDIKSIADNSLGTILGVTAVSYAGRLTTTWANIKSNNS